MSAAQLLGYGHMLEFITDTQIYEQVIRDRIPKAKEFVWLATADLKDLHMDKRGQKRMVPFLEILSDLIAAGLTIRLLHAKEPGPAFRRDFDRYPDLLHGLKRIVCPRVHFKSVVIDGEFAYSGSANLTGAGMGAKSSTRRNFESGIITTDEKLVAKIMAQFNTVWTGHHCSQCKRKQYCAEH